MAIGTPTEVGGFATHNASDATTTLSWSAFTPAVGDIIVVAFSYYIADTLSNAVSCSNNGFTVDSWTQYSVPYDLTGFATWVRTGFFVGRCTASASGVVTLTRTDTNNTSWQMYGRIATVTGCASSTYVAQSGTAVPVNSSTAQVTLGSAVTAGNALMTVVFDAGGSGGQTPPTGHTQLTRFSENGDDTCWSYSLSPPSNAPQWSTLQSQPNVASNMVVIELAAPAAGIAGLTPLPRRKLVTKVG